MIEDRNGGRVDDNGGLEREGRYCQLVRATREKEARWKEEGEKRKLEKRP